MVSGGEGLADGTLVKVTVSTDGLLRQVDLVSIIDRPVLFILLLSKVAPHSSSSSFQLV
jgi:hypothetical protein